MKLINDKAVRATDVSRLSKYTKYEFQVLAFTSVGDGPKSVVKSETTMEDGKKLVLISVLANFTYLSCINYYVVLLIFIFLIELS